MAIDLKTEAYEMSSELFSFKDMRRGIIEHGKVCYIEGYKKHGELFYSFLVDNGYFSDEELHKVTAEFESYLSGVPAISIRTCEDVLRKLNPIIYKNSKVGSNDMPCLNSVQEDIVTIYRDYLKDGKNTLRIMKARQRGISTILSIIAYLETKNEKRVLYIGCDNPTKRLGLKYNQFFTYKESLNNIDLSSQHFDIIIVDDPKFYHLELAQLYPSVGKNGKMIIALTPCSPGSRTYSEIKSFFKCDSAGELKYETGKSDNADELISKYPIHKNEFMGAFID